ncbi:unnamed protein product [Symbiodinium microadriaticum]|nr:unnamed protein product [Symbiodinium microadriaticum]
MDSCNFCSGGAFLGSISLWYLLKALRGNSSSSSAASNDVFSAVEPLALPVIDINVFMNKEKNPELFKQECAKLADALHKYGCAVVRDPRVDYDFNNTFLDMMERYFSISDGKRGQ